MGLRVPARRRLPAVPGLRHFPRTAVGQRVELWGEFGARPPFPTAGDWLWVSYHAIAETQCHIALGWPIPETILDLEAEFRCATTTTPWMLVRACPAPCVRTACVWSDTLEKPAMIKLILRGGPYTAEERRQILDYYWLDTDGLAALLPRMLPGILARPNGWAFALLRGYYSGHCIAHMEWTRHSARRGNLSPARSPLG